MRNSSGIGCGLLVVLAVLFLLGNMLIFPIQAVLLLSMGWILYLITLLPKVRFDGEAIVSGLVYAGLLGVLSHQFMRWVWSSWDRGAGQKTLVPPDLAPAEPPRGPEPGQGLHEDRASLEIRTERRPWQVRQTLRLLSGLMLVFALAMSAAGVLHQLGWLLTTDSRLLDVQFLSRTLAIPERRLEQSCRTAGRELRSLEAQGTPIASDWLWSSSMLSFETLEEHVFIILQDSSPPQRLLVYPRARADRVALGGLLCQGETPEALSFAALIELFPPAEQ